MIPKPRNTLVTVKLILESERRVGKLTVPTNNDCYCEAQIIEVGPGNLAATGGRSETHDLKSGQRVHIMYRRAVKQGKITVGYEECGILIQDVDDSDGKYYYFEQNNILGIIAEPDDPRINSALNTSLLQLPDPKKLKTVA